MNIVLFTKTLDAMPAFERAAGRVYNRSVWRVTCHLCGDMEKGTDPDAVAAHHAKQAHRNKPWDWIR